jgi:IclR family transcriptional regulator, pca regulon regulatory protein
VTDGAWSLQFHSKAELMAKPPGESTTEPFEDSRDYVQSLARGLSALRAFDSEHTHLSLAEIAQRSQLSRAVARRLVLTLQHLGYVRSSGRTYSLSPRVLELGFGYLGTLNLSDLAQPLLEDLAHRIDQSCSMAVLDGQAVVYVLRVPVRRVMTVSLGIGARLPAAATSMGRVLLTGLNDRDLDTWLDGCQPTRHTQHTTTDKKKLAQLIVQARENGYAYVEQELELGLCSLAVPIRNSEGRIAIAINTSMPYQPDVARKVKHELLPALRRTADAVEACLIRNRLPAVSL